jgi:hypothetical protein|nr:MAG TPA: hypothetical protein [Caudoviricetes sp.]DAW12568.1 MAG TPA: hypothetical protein [Caudoviricetes sp.]
MVEVSDRWKEKFNETLVPESFVEITCGITEPGINKKATIVTSSAAPFSTFHNIALSDNASISRYSTGEPNLTVLDGSCGIVPSSPPYGTTGFLSAEIFDDSNHPVIRLELPSENKSSIPGVSICWSTAFNEYATDFSVSAYLGAKKLKTVTVNGNKSIRSDVEVELSGFDAVELEVLKWCLPDRRVRVEQVKIGRYLVFDKTKILSYSHSSARDPISGQLSQESISFSLDNSDRTWDSVNPQGIYKYIYERQPVTVRYGMDVDGKTEWVSGGMFFLSEWSVPANSIEASFQARDAFLYLSSTKYTGRKYGTLYEMCYDALELLEADEITFDISDELKDYSTDITSDESTYHNSDILQLAANAAGMALYQTRDGVIKINRVYGADASNPVLDIPVLNNYSWPEITFAQNMLNVVTTVGNATYAYPENPSGKGVSQTLSNVMLTKGILAKSRNALTESYGVLSNRRKASLTYRASPTIDALDMVKIHHQFNYDAVLLATNVKYTFNGCFKGTVEGYMMADAQAISLDHTSEQLDWGESVILSATLSPASIDSPKINWAASPEGIVSLHVLTNAEGKSTCQVKWNSPGAAIVTASAGGNSASCSFLTTEYYLSNIPEGKTVLMDEGNNVVEFIVAKHGYESELNGVGRTLLIRKRYPTLMNWDSSWSAYAQSDINTWLNGEYLNTFSSAQKEAIGSTTFYYTPGFTAMDFSVGSSKVSTMSKAVFLPSAHEFGGDCEGNDVFGWTKNSPDYKYNEGTSFPQAKGILESMLAADNAAITDGSCRVFTRTPFLYSAEYASYYHSSDRKDFLSRMVTTLEDTVIDGSSGFSVLWGHTATLGPNLLYYCAHPSFTLPETTQIDANGKLVF